MASPDATAQHKAAQSEVVAGLGPAIVRAFGLLDIQNLKGTTPRLQAAIYALVTQYGRASSTLALAHYRQERAAAGIAGRPNFTMAPLPPRGQVDSNVGWAISNLYGHTTPDDIATAETKIEGAAGRLILNVGRESMAGFTNQDRKAKGWAREARPGACWWCRMLATRGGVYKSEVKAGPNVRGFRNARAGVAFKGDGEAKVHDHCHCVIVPVFGAYEMTAQARADASLWQDVTDGLSGEEARQAFRHAIEAQSA